MKVEILTGKNNVKLYSIEDFKRYLVPKGIYKSTDTAEVFKDCRIIVGEKFNLYVSEGRLEALNYPCWETHEFYKCNDQIIISG